MRVAVIGAGSVGVSICKELIHNGHDVLIIDRDATTERTSLVPAAEWIIGDACEISTLTTAELDSYDHVVCATGDDKVNLVVSFLARTEFAVPRTVARVNNPRNEWLFNDSWGVDVAVSTPRLMTALVEEAVSVGEVVRLFEFQHGAAHMVELTLPESSPLVGTRVGDVPLPPDTSLIAILRDGQAISPSHDEVIEAADEILFICPPEAERKLELTLNPDSRVRAEREDD
ncbi:TrkA family potassium uptake protein [Ornithinimicrobium ciconiae]|uniref:Trk system potassium uptake protein TrkA n=1 Tax=Ornithinimicrobium ciconiae TaxID=2594265 RepID=A0A516GAE3_9MICO|nr:TrkA family potassium uptake protein [Ornithinimicrobium ciconiae]QDO88475.1 TrkA family potassium uptake protein [Ornithinimicrobium ciconiae]